MKHLILIAALLFLPLPSHAEPGNAPDTKGNFVLVVATYENECNQLIRCSAYDKPVPIRKYLSEFQITGFKSFKMCEAAGLELLARFNSPKNIDWQQMDFSCVAVSR